MSHAFLKQADIFYCITLVDVVGKLSIRHKEKLECLN